MKTDTCSRREAIIKGLSYAGAVAGGAAAISSGLALADEKKHHDEDITPVEDLMKEHGVIEEIFVIYREIQRRLEVNEPFPAEALQATLSLSNRFAADYHEKSEENNVFPVFEQAGRHVALVKILRTQHDVGRQLTAEMVSLATPAALQDSQNRSRLKQRLFQVPYMYLPHIAHENSILFPDFKALVGEKEYKRMGEAFEKKEEKLFGEGGFRNVVAQLIEIQKSLGLTSLDVFTVKP